MIIIGLMAILFSAEIYFDGDLKLVALINSNLSALKQYSALEGKFTYKLPEQWQTELKDFNSNEIIYHNDFEGKDLKIHGFVQVWNYKEDLKTFLDKSKDLAFKQNKYKAYNIKDIKINGKEGFLLSYVLETSPENYYVGYEYFFKDTDKFIRFSFFVNEKNFKENFPAIFNSIVGTFEYKE